MHLRLLLAFLLAGIAGCGSCSDGGGGGGSGEQEQTPAAAVELAVVEGVVRLAEGAELPGYDPAAMGEGAGRPTPEGCPPLGPSDRQPVRLAGDRALAGVLVQISGRDEAFDRLPPAEARTHDVVIRDCRLQPRLVAATKGDSIRIRNESSYPFLPQLGRSAFSQALLRGQERVLQLDQGGMSSLMCAFAATCGRTDVIIQYRGVYTVTGDDGRFAIRNAPAGEEVVVHAWHPLFQEASATVRTAAARPARAELVLSPAPVAPPPEPPPDREGPAENDPSQLF